MNVDDVLDELVAALIVESPRSAFDQLKVSARFRLISGVCDDLGYVVEFYPAADIHIIEIAPAPIGKLVAAIEVLRAALDACRSTSTESRP